MPQLTTFGFEAEFQTGAAELIAALHSNGLAGTDYLHGYHCDCPDCDFSSEYPFRGQTDSSCSGEVISSIFTHQEGAVLPYTDYPIRTDWREAMNAIEQLAVEVDAEPGITSGLHVHVGIDRLLPQQQYDAFYAFVRWEPVIQQLARGRFPMLRGENRAVRDDLETYEVFDWLAQEVRIHAPGQERYFDSLTSCLRYVEDADNELMASRFREQLFGVHRTHDRHNNLNIRPRRPTWEFRLWNSTRSAWRMEMFTRLSVALVDPTVVANMLAANPGRVGGRITNAQVNRLIEAVDTAGHHECAALMERQRSYSFDRRDEIPSSFSLV